MSASLGETVVRVEGLRKKRSDRQVLDGVSFTLTRGRILGLIGPNGAGKTTTIKILLGLLRPDSGSALVLGAAPMALPPALRQRIGYLSEGSEGSEVLALPIAELLEYHSCFFAAWDWHRCQRLIDRLGVVPDRTLLAMSAGERRKAELVVALAHRPDLLILDDPALGLDALARRDLLWATLDVAREEGTTVLFTSHILQDVEKIVDDVLVLDRGSVRAQGQLEDVLARTKRLVFPAAGTGPGRLEGEIARERHGADVVVVTGSFSPGLLEDVAREHPRVQAEPMNLEQIFCALVDAPATGAPGQAL